MSNIYQSEIYKAQAPGRVNPSRLLDKDVVSGQAEFAVVTYALENGIGAGDVVNLCILPRDVIPLPGLSKVICRGASFNTGISVGTQADTSGWISVGYLQDIGEYGAGATSWTAPTPLEPDPGSDSATVFATLGGSDGFGPGVELTFLLAYKRGR